MGLASLRQQSQISTLRRSEECLNSTPESSSSAESSPDELPNPVWTRQAPPVYGRGPPPADTDTLPR